MFIAQAQQGLAASDLAELLNQCSAANSSRFSDKTLLFNPQLRLKTILNSDVKSAFLPRLLCEVES